MRGAALPAALALAALACLLAFVPPRLRWVAIAIAVVLTLAVSRLTIPLGWHDGAFTLCWAVVIATALGVHLPDRMRGRATVFPFAVASGCAGGLVLAAEGASIDLVRALPAILLVVPFAFARDRGLGIGVKVVSSWLVAIAILAMVLPMVGMPGYVPDHME